MTDDLDPYLADLFAPEPRFSRPEAVGNDLGMNEIPITQEQLAEEAGRWFAGASLEDIPAKLWLDCHVATGQLYLRGTFDKGVKPLTIARMAGLAVALDEIHGTDLIPVAYHHDHTWEEIEGWNQALNRVE